MNNKTTVQQQQQQQQLLITPCRIKHIIHLSHRLTATTSPALSLSLPRRRENIIKEASSLYHHHTHILARACTPNYILSQITSSSSRARARKRPGKQYFRKRACSPTLPVRPYKPLCLNKAPARARLELNFSSFTHGVKVWR